MKKLAAFIVAVTIFSFFAAAGAEEPNNYSKAYEMMKEFPGLNCKIQFFTNPESAAVGLKGFSDGHFDYFWLSEDMEIHRATALANGVKRIVLEPVRFEFDRQKLMRVVRLYVALPPDDYRQIADLMKIICIFLVKTASFRSFEASLEGEVRDTFRNRNNTPVVRRFNRVFHQFFFYVATPDIYEKFAPRIAELESDDKELLQGFDKFLTEHEDELKGYGKETGLTELGKQNPEFSERIQPFLDLLFMDRVPPFFDRSPRPSERPSM
jgi:hypothetical protein